VAGLGRHGERGRSGQAGPACQREEREKASRRKTPLDVESVFQRMHQRHSGRLGQARGGDLQGGVSQHVRSWVGQAEFPGKIQMEE
jgi:hypothetical protein